MYLVLIETSGNQNYIFSTNKLKENIGASELTYLAGTKWVLDTVAEVNHTPQLSPCMEAGSEELRKKLLNPELNRHIEASEDIRIEIIVATSGKALLLARNKEDAHKVIEQITHKALIEAPGLDICGVFEEFNWHENNLGEINSKVHKKFEIVRSQRPSPTLRFLRLPVIDECATSGLPASKLVRDAENQVITLSYNSAVKQKCSEKSLDRMAKLLTNDQRRIRFPRTINELERKFEDLDWVSVIHADGNGLGEIFLKFDQHINNIEQENLKYNNFNRKYIEKLRKFSIALDICTEKAFLSALDAFTPAEDGLIPVVPLVLGGDDLTVVCDGKSALNFTRNFLVNFEKETNFQEHTDVDGIISEIAKEALKTERLSACAGIAIIKPHFSFSVAYELAEKLMQSAKNVKKIVVNDETNIPYPCSALDFHILYDSSDVELDIIRGKLTKKTTDTTLLYTRPYVITDIDKLQETKGKCWAEFHHWEQLQNRVKILVSLNNDGKRKLPNSQMHNLRTGLFLGREVADARYKLIRDRYRDAKIIELVGSEDSLFVKEPESEIYMTGLLDAMDAADFINIESKSDE